MSFGFLTESALLPAKSKPIKVDGRSLVDLKAIVYAKEQKVKLDGGGGSGGLRGLRGLRGKRSSGDKAGGAGARKDPFARSNEGVEDRSERDEVERVTASKKRKAVDRVMAAKSSLYEKMAKGEVGGASRAGSLVDFSRKSSDDLALLEAKAGKPKKRGKGKGDARTTTSSSSGKKRQRGGGSKNHGDEQDSDLSDYDSSSSFGGDLGGPEVEITDEFGRHRTVTRGGREHREHLQAKKRAAKAKVEEEALQKAAALSAAAAAPSPFDERYSSSGNRGRGSRDAALPTSYYGPSSSAPAAAAAAGGDPAGGWAWSSGVGRGADEGDFETRDGQERRAKKDMKELLEREGAGEAGKGDSGAKILSQWEKTLSGDQKTFLQEVQRETEASRRKAAPASTATGAEAEAGAGLGVGQTSRERQRAERKELLRRKQEARAARLRGDA
eukprot:g8938.t1